MTGIPLPDRRSRRVGRFAASLLACVAAAAVASLAIAPALVAAGPPFPAPVAGQRVYDNAGVLSKPIITLTETHIRDIETATGAQVVVYTQLVDPSTTTADADAQAQALMDQWGVGRKGFDDGLVILFDMYQGNTCHGQVQLYAGPGFSATYLTNDERQAIYQNDMLPELRSCAISSALDVAMGKIVEATTPEHAATLQQARQLNAVLGLVVAPLVLLVFVGGGLLRWWRFGRDPVYLDDPSILMPTPPPGLTPAAGAAIREGKVTRRALTAASLDLAVRGMVSFKAEPPAEGESEPGLGIFTGAAVTGDAAEQARTARARSRQMDAATTYLGERLSHAAGAKAYLPPDKITVLAGAVDKFNRLLEQHLVKQGWYDAAPSKASGGSCGLGLLLFLAAVGVFVLGVNLPSSGAVLVGIAMGISSIALPVIGSAMARRTKDGAVVRAMLEAYRRTLEKTMALARSMGEVATNAAIPLIESPDDAVAWSVALGLNDEVEAVLQRSAEDQAAGSAGVYLPAWYLPWGMADGTGPATSSAAGGFAPGLMSSSPIPDFGGMMAALGTIGTPPESSGGSSGGSSSSSFGGGGSGGGGGGAGGGF